MHLFYSLPSFLMEKEVDLFDHCDVIMSPLSTFEQVDCFHWYNSKGF
jgi:hypothetical protein